MNDETRLIDLLKSAVRDGQDLIRSEIALAKAELREEGRRFAAAVALLAGAAVAGVFAVLFLVTTLAWLLAAAFAWPAWGGFAVVTVLLIALAAGLGAAGRRQITRGPHFPKTIATMKENAQWIRARTS